MFQDIGVSKDLNDQFKKYISHSGRLECKFLISFLCSCFRVLFKSTIFSIQYMSQLLVGFTKRSSYWIEWGVNFKCIDNYAAQEWANDLKLRISITHTCAVNISLIPMSVSLFKNGPLLKYLASHESQEWSIRQIMYCSLKKEWPLYSNVLVIWLLVTVWNYFCKICSIYEHIFLMNTYYYRN